MHGIGLEEPLQFWFDFKVPRTTVSPHLIGQAIATPGKPDADKQNLRVFWLGNIPELEITAVTKKGKTAERAVLTFYEKAEDFQIKTSPVIGQWLVEVLNILHTEPQKPILLKELAQRFPDNAGLTFHEFLISPTWLTLREKGLLLF
jgi:hypothetical protein